ncbi:MAG TPA: redoxin domain-containing protein [Leptospiraceae bacterium]|nr:redoxin domain-containing protein [Leptospiraceae bacterium]HMW05269.1 redoxin domain-containing protein [Leptospiraceae bacterium]HMX33642.1 redoxin domain-containing protein [Leptospiraceae bacterium]HMY31465.1 redoxin domain-containing protein [Leptospiraceae bacterium]HMZ66004.1 redoxin domain-containing protein [Leptospiraceae bacterium]
MIKRIFVILSLLFLASISAYVIYVEDTRYSLPTPIPTNYENIPIGSTIVPPNPILSVRDKPLLIHFFNPHCPCSRFNLEHFKALVLNYSDKVDFAIVLQIEKENALEKFKRMDLNLPYVEDKTGEIADRYGVYSTPQAVILDKKGNLYYRGNYNKSRYCSLKSSEYARLALQSLLREEKLEDLPVYAKIAYGCQLPSEGLNQIRIEFLDDLFSIF